MQKILSIILLLAVLGAGSLYAQTNIGTVQMEGSKIKLNVPIMGFHTSLQSGWDASTGMATGKRQHSPITILRISDGSSPLLQQATASNETFKTVTILLNKPSARRDSYLQIRLTNATIASMSLSEGVNGNGQTLSTDPAETISIIYESIQFVYTDGKEVFKDNWTGK